MELDPFSGIDLLAVNEINKKMEQKEVYDYERDRPGPSIVQEQFDKIVDERFRRVKMEKRKGEEKRSLENLQAFNKWYAEQVNELEDQLRVVSKKQAKTLNRIEKLKYNFEVIVYLKQGQVEVTQAPVATDYKDAILILKSDINL